MVFVSVGINVRAGALDGDTVVSASLNAHRGATSAVIAEGGAWVLYLTIGAAVLNTIWMIGRLTSGDRAQIAATHTRCDIRCALRTTARTAREPAIRVRTLVKTKAINKGWVPLPCPFWSTNVVGVKNCPTWNMIPRTTRGASATRAGQNLLAIDDGGWARIAA